MDVVGTMENSTENKRHICALNRKLTAVDCRQSQAKSDRVL
jgi:hypothetical protein